MWGRAHTGLGHTQKPEDTFRVSFLLSLGVPGSKLKMPDLCKNIVLQ